MRRLAAITAVGLACGHSALAATYIVNSGADSNTSGTLRWAITQANANPGLDTINIMIGSGLRTITLASALPTITDAVLIDAMTQPGYAGSPLVQLNGGSAPAGTNGFVITTSGVTIRGFSIIASKATGIVINGNVNVVSANYIGLTASGAASGNTHNGVYVGNGADNQIGPGNVISANGADGVRLDLSGSIGNRIIDNHIGTNPAGTAALGNSFNGVVVTGASGNRIGGDGGDGNVIAGNARNGVVLASGASGNVLIRNHIGVDVGGGTALGNGWDGVVIVDSSNNFVGGATAGQYNVMSANLGDGVEIRGASNGNIVQRGLIGTNLAANAALGNFGYGIRIASSGTLVGRGHWNDGGNLISGNGAGALWIEGNGNTVRGNQIGTNAAVTALIPNGSGVTLAGTASDNVIGGVGHGNLITGNGGTGILVGAGIGNRFRENRIAAHGGLGIDLGGDGVTANDSGDGDAGANGLQNFPMVTAALVNGIYTYVNGTFSAQANTTYTLEFFASPACDPSGYGEGSNFAKSFDVTTDANGNMTFSAMTNGWPLGTAFTATATRASYPIETSEFSPCVVSQPAPAEIRFELDRSDHNEGDGSAVITLLRLGNTVTAASVRVDSRDEYGTAGLDYQPIVGQIVQFAPGQTQATVTVTLLEDNLYEGPGAESLLLDLSSPSAGDVLIEPTRFRVVINDNDPIPTLSIVNGGCSVSEGNTGVSYCNLIARLSNPTRLSVSFRVDVTAGSASASIDFGAQSNVFHSIDSGQLEGVIAVAVFGDLSDEDDETFAVTVRNVSQATPSTLSAIGTIVDDDSAPTLSIDNGGCSVTEGNSGNTNCVFTVRVSAPSSRTISFNASVGAGTATLGSDFSAIAAARQIAPGQTTLAINVPVTGETRYEYDETFAFALTGTQNASPAALNATGSIVNDDIPPDFTVAPCVVAEGDAGTTPCNFQLQLTAAAERPLQLQYWTDVSGNRLAPANDASLETPAVTTAAQLYAAGQTVGLWQVEGGNIEHKSNAQWQASHLRQSFDLHGNMPGTIARDIATVPGQRYEVSFALSGHPSCATRVTGVNVGFGNQSLGTYSFDSNGHSTLDMGWRYQRQEVVANAATTRLRFASTTPGSCGSALDDFAVTTVGGTSAVSGIDFEPSFAPYDAPLVLAAGATTRSIVVPVIGDIRDEGDEDMQLWVCVLGGGQCHPAPATIIDDDGPLANLIMKSGFE